VLVSEPSSGSGYYVLTLREIVQPTPTPTQIPLTPTISTVVNPTSIDVGQTADVTVLLSNVPAEGYTSAEFTCSYDPALVQANTGSIVLADVFGADAVVAINGPQNGSFIVAIAGSSGHRAVADGAVFTFSVAGLQAGQTAIECAVRVSKGDNVLTTLPSTATSLTITGLAPTPTQVVPPTEIATATPVESSTPGATSTPDGSVTPTPDGSSTATPTPTPAESSTPETSPTPFESPTPSATPLPTTGTISGQVLAGKPVTVVLFSEDHSVANSVTANTDGTFSMTAPAGTYTVSAIVSGFLSAEGSITLTNGSTVALPTVTLLAGDIDNNNVIDQFDALTIGMNYNAAAPAAADLNADGIINVLDLELLARNYRATGPLAWQ